MEGVNTPLMFGCLIGLPVIALFLLAISGPSFGQSNADINAAVQLSFEIPGTRALGMAGASTAMCDVTAVASNPATAVCLERSAAALEWRRWSHRAVFTYRGHAFGEPTGVGEDSVAGLIDRETTQRTSGPSLAVAAFRLGRVVVSAFGATLLDMQATTETREIHYGSYHTSLIGETRSAFDFTVRDFGLQGTIGIGDNVGLGLGLVAYHGSLSSVTRRYAGPGFEPPDYRDQNVVFLDIQDGFSTSLGATLGVFWRPSVTWALGAAFRRGAKLDVEAQNIAGPADSPPEGHVYVDKETSLRIPDSLIAGVTFQATPGCLLALDVRVVRYSQISDAIVSLYPWDLRLAAGVTEYRVADGLEVRGGAEYVFRSLRFPVAVRAGIWSEPDHVVKFGGSDLGQRTIFRHDGGGLHTTTGLGIEFGPRIAVDVGVDLGKRADIWSVGMRYRGGS